MSAAGKVGGGDAGAGVVMVLPVLWPTCVISCGNNPLASTPTCRFASALLLESGAVHACASLLKTVLLDGGIATMEGRARAPLVLCLEVSPRLFTACTALVAGGNKCVRFPLPSPLPGCLV